MRLARRLAGVGGALICAVLVAGACASSRSASCIEVREPLDPQSSRHVIDPESVKYESDPPTSGPHLAVPVPTGVLDEPLADPIQVRVLEAGLVLVQWEGVGATTLAELERLAGSSVVVAPGSELPAPIVATAWTWKLTCDEIDHEALGDFVESRARATPGLD